MAGSANPKQIQEADFQLEGTARQCQLAADLVETRYRPLPDAGELQLYGISPWDEWHLLCKHSVNP